jgi:hypothetical protein
VAPLNFSRKAWCFYYAGSIGVEGRHIARMPIGHGACIVPVYQKGTAFTPQHRAVHFRPEGHRFRPLAAVFDEV